MVALGVCSVEVLKESLVQRDMDLIRTLLLNIEADPRFDGSRGLRLTSPEDVGITDRSAEEVGYHLDLLIEAGLLKGKSGFETLPALYKMTWQGHEFTDNIKNNEIWHQVKKRLAGLTTVGFSVMIAIAESEIKRKLGLP